MNKLNFISLIFLLIFCSACTKDVANESLIKEKSLDLQVYEAYEEGINALRGGDTLFAAKKFNEVEILYPQSSWAPQSALMAAYSYYSQDYYGDAIAELTRFQRVYPNHKNLDYANYLLAVCYYEQIVDEKKDHKSIKQAKDQFTYIVNNYPNTEYALDSEFKIDLINDLLAAKEMYVGRYYIDKKKWIPAINRFRTVIDEYERTIYVEEALHRLVEIYYTIGLKEESKKYANLLGYNYKSSMWYEKSYIVFNRNYEKTLKQNIKKNKKNNKILSKFKSLFE